MQPQSDKIPPMCVFVIKNAEMLGELDLAQHDQFLDFLKNLCYNIYIMNSKNDLKSFILVNMRSIRICLIVVIVLRPKG